MGIFDFLKKKNTINPADEFIAGLEAMNKEDYLGDAAKLSPKIQEAIAEKNFDLAWSLSLQKKELYLKHGSRCKFTEEQIYALDSSVHKTLANILYLEGKHQEALVHILYWAIANKGRNLKNIAKVYSPYFKRCNFKIISLLQFKELIDADYQRSDLLTARELVKEILNREKNA